MELVLTEISDASRRNHIFEVNIMKKSLIPL